MPLLVYSDHDYDFDEDAGERVMEPVYKPQPSAPYLYCFNYIGFAVAYARELLEDVPDTELFSEQGQYQLAIKAFARPARVLHVPELLFNSRRQQTMTTPEPFSTESPWSDINWIRADNGNRLRASEAWDENPSVDLIIPTRDGLAVLKPCIDSILRQTTQADFHIYLVDNGSELEETRLYFEQITHDPRITVLEFPGEFNYSAINNFGVRAGHGQFIALVNNDIEVIDPDWLTQMLVWAKQPQVGVVGAKLLFGNGLVQHAGVTIGMGNAAGHIHRLEDGDAPGYQNRCIATQNMMAVTAACLITPRALFEELGGLNEELFKVAYNDIDYCLRVESRGLDIIWTPEARLYHHESVSRGDDMSNEHIERYFRELGHLQKRWKTKGFVDKYYNKHLRISDEGVYPQITVRGQDKLRYC
jgi:GT2 family glycosyltransferase